MTAVLVPDLARALAAHHARAHRAFGGARMAEQRAIGRRDGGRPQGAGRQVCSLVVSSLLSILQNSRGEG